MTQDMAGSIKIRLTELGKGNRQYRDTQRLMVRYAIERFMWRVGQSRHADDFTLKGAMAFTYHHANSSRTTGDADFLMRGDYSAATLKGVLADIARIQADDGVTFDANAITVREAGKERAYPGYSARVPARLGASPCHVLLDISFGEAVYPEAKRVAIPALLLNKSFYPVLRVYPIETIIAEKYQTIVRLGMGNTRLKDHHDLYEIGESKSVAGGALQKAIQATFTRRGTPVEAAVPLGLSESFYADKGNKRNWKITLADHDMPRNADLQRVCASIFGMIGPVLAATVNGEEFNLVWRDGEWRAP